MARDEEGSLRTVPLSVSGELKVSYMSATAADSFDLDTDKRLREKLHAIYWELLILSPLSEDLLGEVLDSLNEIREQMKI